MQSPWMTATVGFGRVANACSAAMLTSMKLGWVARRSARSSVMSAPAQKWSPSPRSTTTRTASSRAIAWHAASSAVHIS